MAAKLYKVQTWDAQGALTSHYETWIESAAELRELKKFLKQKWAHVAIAAVPASKRSR